jgi:hypothetical protein
MVVDEDRGHLLIVTLVGPGATERLRAATIAVAGQVLSYHQGAVTEAS